MNYYKRHLGDYAKKTRTLTVMQHGIYTLLLDLYYSEEAPVTSADAYTVCQARTAKDRAAVDVILSKFFTQDGDVWRNQKADEVIGKYHAKAPKNAENGRLGGLAKAKRNASETLEECQPNADINHKPITINNEEEKPARKRAEFAKPDWVPAAEWDAFLESRRKNPPTARAKELLVRELEKLRDLGHDPAQVLEQSTRNGWRDVFPLRSGNAGSTAGRKLSLSEETELGLERFRQRQAANGG